jgi:hypothetical protein
MVDVPTRTLRSFVATLPNGGNSGVIDRDLNIRNDLVTNEQGLPVGGNTNEVLAKVSPANFDVAWVAAGAGDMLKSVYDPQNINADAFARANQTGTQDASTITGLGTGAFVDASTLATLTGTQTLTNKRITKRVSSSATMTTLTPDANGQDVVALTAQDGALTIAAPTGTPTDGQVLTIRLRDNGTSRALTWDAAYVFYDAGQKPAATVAGRTLYVSFMFNAATSTWDAVGGNLVGLWA